VPKASFEEYDDETAVAVVEAVSSIQSWKLVSNAKRLNVSTDTVHWGYFSKTIEPVISVFSGEVIIVEMAARHACNGWDRMLKGDPRMEDVYTWSPEVKN
jgi:hypothetical protein